MGALCGNPTADWFMACIFNEPDIVQKLIKKCVGTVDQDAQVLTGLMTAINWHNQDIVRILVQHEFQFVTPEDIETNGFIRSYLQKQLILSGGSSALHVAVLKQDVDCLVEIAMQISDDENLQQFAAIADDQGFTALELATAFNWNLMPVVIQCVPHYFVYMEAHAEKEKFNWLSVSIDFGNLQMLKFIMNLYTNEPDLVEHLIIQYNKGELEDASKLLPNIQVDQQQVEECKEYFKKYLSKKQKQTKTWIKYYIEGEEYDTYMGYEELKVERQRVKEIKEARKKYFVEHRKQIQNGEGVDMKANPYLKAVYEKYGMKEESEEEEHKTEAETSHDKIGIIPLQKHEDEAIEEDEEEDEVEEETEDVEQEEIHVEKMQIPTEIEVETVVEIPNPVRKPTVQWEEKELKNENLHSIPAIQTPLVLEQKITQQKLEIVEQERNIQETEYVQEQTNTQDEVEQMENNLIQEPVQEELIQEQIYEQQFIQEQPLLTVTRIQEHQHFEQPEQFIEQENESNLESNVQLNESFQNEAENEYSGIEEVETNENEHQLSMTKTLQKFEPEREIEEEEENYYEYYESSGYGVEKQVQEDSGEYYEYYDEESVQKPKVKEEEEEYYYYDDE
ncbi:Ankyrin_repeat-containing domain superfamily [Hexamita inflata]|uniref:Ankyrin repeat-containing domain superfamily n=1 Tax=Hexamita inflata TaxID=28002 RepID=A0AA86QT14_9EUKA|nr:Ankyrin repeat-containing domain superfamily [Hexamita inflata]